MVLEVAIFDIVPGREAAFTDAYRNVRHLVEATEGCRSVRMTRGVESPARFVLLIEWDSVEAHEVGFRASDRFPKWRAAIGEFFASPPVVEHFSDV
ncbi:antibiotic biosynthesis monooxygenase [Phytomonospora sp. NPDC050363]|uniref:antibiotic biosynthesis monooxygenase family protein n=1 Tax=Phytomonospora sp. NPDC050363 TaxID=3155642 RepID=UPI003407F58F